MDLNSLKQYMDFYQNNVANHAGNRYAPSYVDTVGGRENQNGQTPEMDAFNWANKMGASDAQATPNFFGGGQPPAAPAYVQPQQGPQGGGIYQRNALMRSMQPFADDPMRGAVVNNLKALIGAPR